MTTSDMLDTLPTPALILDEFRMLRNVDRLRSHLSALSVTPRPHLKTVKSVEAARRLLTNGNGPAAVSTLRRQSFRRCRNIGHSLRGWHRTPEAEPGAGSAGQRLRPQHRAGLARAGDRRCPQASRQRRAMPLPALIEIDCDDHRSGLRPDDPFLIHIGRDPGTGRRHLARGGHACR